LLLKFRLIWGLDSIDLQAARNHPECPNSHLETLWHPIKNPIIEASAQAKAPS